MRRRIGFWLVVGALPGLAALGFVLDQLYPPLLPDEQAHFARVVVDERGDPLRAFADEAGVWRYPIALSDVSPLYVQVLLNYEDRWFWWHPGINPVSLIRATALNLRHGRIVSGGSTLTMQVARLLHPHSRSIGGKLFQMLRALQLEWHLDKHQILTLYLNVAPFGGAVEGVQAASYAYLGKSARRLSHAEAALLAVLPQAPTRLRPDRSPELARRARDKVIDRLVGQEFWKESVAEQAKLEPIATGEPRRKLRAALLAERLVRRGVSHRVISTTIDGDLQAALEGHLSEYVETLPARSSAAVLVVDNLNLAVKAYLGTANFADSGRFGYLDMIRAIRSPGSTLKPFLFALALDEGLIHSHSLFADAPRINSYRPGNFSGGFAGPVSAAEALRRSLNVPFVDLIERYGPARFAAQLDGAGLNLSIPHGRPNPAIILGGAGATLEGLVMAYAALARGGKVAPLRYLRSELQGAPTDRHWLTPASAWIVSQVLRFGSGLEPARTLALRGHQRMAWKTGTSYGMRDAWAVGVGNRHTIGVWVGRPDGTPVPKQGGRTTAGPLLFAVAEHLGTAQGASPKPDAVEQVEICWPLGIASQITDEAHCHQRHLAWTIRGNTPPTWHAADQNQWRGYLFRYLVAADSNRRVLGGCAGNDYRFRSVALWPKVLEPWLPSSRRRSRAVPALMDDCSNAADAPSGVKIAGIPDGAVYRGIGTPRQAPAVELKAIGASGSLHWYIDGRLRYSVEADQVVSHRLQGMGTRQLLVQDDSGGIDKIDIGAR